MNADRVAELLGTTERGYTHNWILESITKLDAHLPALHVEVREVLVEPTVYHSILRVKIENKWYLIDGTGFGQFDAYFGLEKKPRHTSKTASLI